MLTLLNKAGQLKSKRLRSLFVLAISLSSIIGLSTAAARAGAPTINPGGVVNGVTYTYEFHPGTTMAIFGQNFSASGNTVYVVQGGQTWQLPRDNPAWWYESTTQINATLPYAVGYGNANVYMTNSSGVASNTQTINVQPPPACNCYFSYDCPGGQYCGGYGSCSAVRKWDGTCRSTGGARNESLEHLAGAVDLYLQAYQAAIKEGGGNPDPRLIRRALEVPLSAKTREGIEDAIWTALDAVIGWDFMIPTSSFRSGGYMGNIRGVPGVEEGWAIIEATRQGMVKALQARNSQVVVEPLIDFWQKSSDYHPHHTGRCYPHGHNEIQEPSDILMCQMETLTRILEGWLSQGN